MIFVQIASYRDPELLPTIIDCLAKAKHKKDLTFGICWQKSSRDQCLEPLKPLKNFRILEIPWHESEGLCWARSKIQKLYEGEEYTLLDSHHRFAEHWDEKLIEACELTGSPKPIITAYVGMYDPATNQKHRFAPCKMVADKFTESGTILFRPHYIPDWENLIAPIHARFVSGHFFFTVGQHCVEYTYDPKLYFAGDEISLSIRSFTLGYDLFHPHRSVIWHEYTRQGRIKHWDDHTIENREKVGVAWHERDVGSKRRLRKLLKEEDNDEDLSGFGLGSIRPHRDYELYAGIDFAGRRLHCDTRQGIDPPCTYIDDKQWQQCLTSTFNIPLKWNIDDIERCTDFHFIYFGVEDAAGNVLYRYDAPSDSPEAQLLIDQRNAEFIAAAAPARLVVWPVSQSRGWLRKMEYAL